MAKCKEQICRGVVNWNEYLTTKVNMKKGKQLVASLGYLLPSLLGILVFFVLPFCVIIFYSFVDSPIHPGFVLFENYINLLKNAAFQKAAMNTLKFSLIAVPAAVVLPLGLAMILDKRIPLCSQFRTFFLSPMMVPAASIVLIWRVLFHYNGVINNWIIAGNGYPIDWLKSDYSMVVIVLLFLWKNLGYNMIIFMAALSNIPRDMVEVAKLDTSSNLIIFIYVKLRYLSPALLFVTVFSIVNSFKIFREVYLLTNDYPYDSLFMIQHYMNNVLNQLDYQKLSAAAVLLAIVIIVLIGILFFVEEKYGRDMEV